MIVTNRPVQRPRLILEMLRQHREGEEPQGSQKPSRKEQKLRNKNLRLRMGYEKFEHSHASCQKQKFCIRTEAFLDHESGERKIMDGEVEQGGIGIIMRPNKD